MFVRLKENICLRGWKNIPYAIDFFGSPVRPVPITRSQAELLAGSFLYFGEDTFQTWLKDNRMLEECPAGACLRESQKYKNYGNLYFDQIIFSITGKCNYKCRHCSVSAPGAVMGEMTYEELESLIVQFRECGLKNITLIGGEPLVRPDFMRIVDRILEEGLFVSSVYTNGSLIDEELLQNFEKRRIHPAFQISYDGYGFHDRMRGVAGAEERFFRSLRLLKKYDYPVTCYMSMTKESIVSLPKTVTVLAEEGVSSLTVFPPFDCGNWESVPEEEKLTFGELLEAYIHYIPQYIEADFPLTLNLYRIAFFSAPKRKYMLIPKSSFREKALSKCPACRTFGTELNISPEGLLSPCYAIMGNEYVKTYMPNVLHIPLKDALTDSEFTRCIELKASDILHRNEKCRNCGYQLQCGGGCRSSALLSEQDFQAPDPAMCFTFEHGYYERLRAAVQLGYEKRREKILAGLK